ncbi:MAG: type ISP restriction/modification enzyme, partial [Patescibacteria group bacterium]
IVEKISYKDEKVWINEEQFFGGVPVAAWNFYIGGYQPAQKWLKDRKGHVLSNNDIEHYQKIIVILTATDRIMREIDGTRVKNI